MQSEKVIQKDIIKLLKERGAWVVKIEAGRNHNTVDLFGIYKGLGFVIEVKKEDCDPIKAMTKLQAICIRDVQLIGKGYAICTNSVAVVGELLCLMDRKKIVDV